MEFDLTPLTFALAEARVIRHFWLGWLQVTHMSANVFFHDRYSCAWCEKRGF